MVKKSARRTRREHASVPGADSPCGIARGQHNGQAVQAVRTAPQPDHRLETQQLLENAANVFGGTVGQEKLIDLVPLHAKIGQLTLKNDFLEHALTKAVLLSAKP